MKVGTTVTVTKANGIWAEMFIGQTGTIIRKCGLYRGAWMVQFSDGYVASFYPAELKVS